MSSQLPFDQVTLLKDRNDKLSAQAAVHRQEIARLQRRIDELVERETPWKETLLCVNRLWEELNETIAFLRYRYVPNGVLFCSYDCVILVSRALFSA